MTTTGRGMGATLTRARVGGHPTSSRSWSPSHRCGVGAELAAAVAENTAPGTATLRQSTPTRIHRLMVVPPFTRKAGHPVVLGSVPPPFLPAGARLRQDGPPPGSTLRRTPMVVKKTLVAVARSPAAGDAATDTLHHVLHPARIGRSNALQVVFTRWGQHGPRRATARAKTDPQEPR